ncbi:Tn3 transposase DDE domain-containing protein [Nonomuraea polychroma]|uniref:Tn3 transposase DDE domain-containing protein n=1 Tax=Nonomuraea polychroma TaxID=46176 RepID=A0A438M5Z9_9ACTN|nr:Tn3 family transposase [Nonomuraea polychroma]RVX41091.1 Tn3 transposase DDE domain-containing protein [Nonomuraea polychroma]
MTDTGSYSDLVYGMFAMCGYQLAPRHADISDTQLWWIDTAMLEGGLTTGTRATTGWAAFNSLGLPRVSIPAIVQHWDDMARVAASSSRSICCRFCMWRTAAG